MFWQMGGGNSFYDGSLSSASVAFSHTSLNVVVLCLLCSLLN